MVCESRRGLSVGLGQWRSRHFSQRTRERARGEKQQVPPLRSLSLRSGRDDRAGSRSLHSARFRFAPVGMTEQEAGPSTPLAFASLRSGSQSRKQVPPLRSLSLRSGRDHRAGSRSLHSARFRSAPVGMTEQEAGPSTPLAFAPLRSGSQSRKQVPPLRSLSLRSGRDHRAGSRSLHSARFRSAPVGITEQEAGPSTPLAFAPLRSG